jgi:hypothetical protein
VAKPGADLKIFIDSTIGHHGVLLGKIFSLEENFLERIKYFRPMPILMRNLERHQITRNDSKVMSLSENDTLPAKIMPLLHSPASPPEDAALHLPLWSCLLYY